MSLPEPTPDAPDPETLRAVLADCIDRIGEAGTLAAAEPILAAHPTLAPTLRERLAKLLRTGLLPIDAPTPSHPERLGEFRLLRPLGRGGMGAVYLAVQESLDREVALKLVHPELLYFPGARERFHREVEAIARLHDPGIVPIYTVGEDHGVPFFAMEHIAGATLAEVITTLRGRSPATLQGRDLAAAIAGKLGVAAVDPLPELFQGNWLEACCGIVRRMALAAEHAHQRGVLHRDLKPSNAMITPDGRVLLLDFGLAAAEGSTELTKSGAMLGTLNYMAPEQLRCVGVDARTDVYALGATLYELVALAPAHHSENSESLRQKILQGSVAALTDHNRSAPRDVETICRKALDPDPARRYQSALDLAADLDRYGQRRPIVARRKSPLLRARRFVQRHPAWAATVLVVCLGTATAAMLSWQRAEARGDSDANLASALLAIGRLVDQAKDPRVQQVPGLDAMRVEQLDDAVSLITNLRHEGGRGPHVRHALAKGLLEAGLLRRQLGLQAGANEAIAAAVDILRELSQQQPEEPTVRLDLARTIRERAALRRDGGDLSGATAEYQNALDLLPPPANADLGALALRSTVTVDLALMDKVAGNLDRAEERLRAARDLDERRLTADRSRQAVLDTGRTRSSLAALLQQRGQHDAAIAELTALGAIHDQLAATGAADPELRRERARTSVALARSHAALSHFDEAVPAAAASLASYEELVRDFPQRTTYQWERNMVQLEIAGIAAANDDDQGAATTYRSALANHEELLRSQPGKPELASEAALMAGQLATLLQRRGEREEVTALLRRSIALLAPPAAAKPDDAHWRQNLISLRVQLGKHCLAIDEPAEAIEQFTLLSEQFDAEVRTDKPPGALARLAFALQMLAVAHATADDPDRAMETLSRLQQQAALPRPQLLQLGQELHLSQRADFVALAERAQ